MPFLPLPLPFCRFVDFLPLPLNMVHFVPSNPVRTLYYYPSVLPPKPVSWCCFGIYLTGVPVAGSASWWPGQHSLSLRCDSGEQQQQRWRHATGTIIKPIVEKHVQSQRINKPRICSRESIFYAPKYSPPLEYEEWKILILMSIMWLLERLVWKWCVGSHVFKLSPD